MDYSEIGQSTRLICESVSLLDSLNESQSKQILGVQGNIWGEFIPSRERMHYMAFPRLLAIAETGWSQAANYNWKSFQRRMTGQFNRLDALGIDYRMADLEGFCNTNTFIGETKVNVISPDPDVVIHYTDDGTEPTENRQYTPLLYPSAILQVLRSAHIAPMENQVKFSMLLIKSRMDIFQR